MINLDIIERKFKSGENWENISRIKNKYFLCSLDIEDESECPVIETNPGKFFLSDDIKIR